MRRTLPLAALAILMAFVTGASSPAKQPASQPAISKELQRDVKLGMNEAQAREALDKAGVKVVNKVVVDDDHFSLQTSDFRTLVFAKGKLHGISKDNLAEKKAGGK